VKPQISPALFVLPKSAEPDMPHQANVSKRRNEVSKPVRRRSVASDDFGDEDIDDDALLNVSLGDLEFDHIENYANPMDLITRKNTAKNKTTKSSNVVDMIDDGNSNIFATNDEVDQPVQLDNGKWACNHPCKDKTGCKHLCCKTGLDKPPKKKAMTKRTPLDEYTSQIVEQKTSPKGKNTQTKLQLTASKRKSSAPIEELDLTQQEKKRKAEYATDGPRDYRDLHQLHRKVEATKFPQSLHSVMHTKPAYNYSEGGEHILTCLASQSNQQPQTESDYGEISFDDLTPQPVRTHSPGTQKAATCLSVVPESEKYVEYPCKVDEASQASENFGEDDSLLGDAMVGVLDSQHLQTEGDKDHDFAKKTEEDLELDLGEIVLSSRNLQADVLSQSHGDAIRDHSEHFRVADKGPWDEVLEQKPEHRSVSHSCYTQFLSQHSKRVNADREDVGLRKLELPKLTPQVDATLRDEYDEKTTEGIFNRSDVKPPLMTKVEDNPVPDAFRDLEPWLFKEFGDIVELVD